MNEKQSVTRRGFLETTGAATGALVAAGAFPHPAVGAVKGANERLNFAIIGPGGRAQAHIDILLKMKKEGKPVDIIAVADVYEGNREAAKKKTEGKQAEVDYRKVLENKDVDGVVIATPDHWHAKQTIDAMEAGKDVYCEKPMTHTIDEARQVAETVKKTQQVMTVGVQSTADPRWRMANELITAGKIGHVMQAQTSYYRNSSVGQWRYYPLKKDMTPKTVDWKMFLGTEFGLAPDMPFNRAKFAQWRCYWEFGGGMYTDLFVHQLTHLIQAMGVRFPRRVVGGGGLYLEYDGRDVPDVATVVADYDEGCQVIVTATMANDHPIEEVIRGHTGTIKFAGDGFDILPQKLANRPGTPSTKQAEAAEHISAPQPELDTLALWEHFLGVHPLAEPRDPLPGRDRLRRDRDGQHGRPVVPRRQGALLRQGDGQGLRGRRVVGQAVGEDEQGAGEAEPGHGLARRDDRLPPRPPRLPEARRRLGRRQGPRRRGLSPRSLDSH